MRKHIIDRRLTKLDTTTCVQGNGKHFMVRRGEHWVCSQEGCTETRTKSGQPLEAVKA